jgi:uncharacterized membrane protein YdbT with pleckstrin-like domain
MPPKTVDARGDRAMAGRTMKYTEKVLQPGETIRFSSRVHWIVYLRGIVFIVLGIVVGVLLRRFVPNSTGGYSIPALIAIGVGLFFGILSLIGAWWQRFITEVVVTNRRIIYKRGFLKRQTFEMNMEKVESVRVDQSIFGRMLGYGTVVIRGTGSSFEPLPLIDHPLEFRNYVTAG